MFIISSLIYKARTFALHCIILLKIILLFSSPRTMDKFGMLAFRTLYHSLGEEVAVDPQSNIIYSHGHHFIVRKYIRYLSDTVFLRSFYIDSDIKLCLPINKKKTTKFYVFRHQTMLIISFSKRSVVEDSVAKIALFIQYTKREQYSFDSL